MNPQQLRVLWIGAYVSALVVSGCADNAQSPTGGEGETTADTSETQTGADTSGTGGGTSVAPNSSGASGGDSSEPSGGDSSGASGVDSSGDGDTSDREPMDSGTDETLGTQKPPDAGTNVISSEGGTDVDEHSWEGCSDFELPPDCTIPDGLVLPGELRCTGLYSDWETRALRCGVQPYEPAHELWADGAGKQRYVWLPPGQTIDVSDPDDFVYPVGTRFWKEFHVGPEGNQTLGETRYMVKSSLGWLYTVYVWDEAGSTATQHNDGVDDLFATGHGVPSREECKTCHEGRQDFILGWDFIMLGEGATGVTARSLADDGLLTGLDPAWLELEVPGNDVEQAALSYLHANCGVSCHNTTLDAAGLPSGLYLRLEENDMESPLTTAAAAGINKSPEPNAKMVGLPELVYYGIRPGDLERSLLYVRMNVRGSQTAMPPIGTHEVDPEGMDSIKAWIESMTVEAGYPEPAP